MTIQLERVKRALFSAGAWMKAQPQRGERVLFRTITNLFGARLTAKEVQEKCDEGVGLAGSPDFSTIQAGDKLLDQFIRQFDLVEKRRAHVEDKAKIILTLIAFIFSCETVATALWGAHWSLILPLVPALGTVWLFFEMFAVGMTGVPQLDQAIVNATDAEISRKVAESYSRALRHNDLRTDYVTSILIAARRMALTALLVLVGILAHRAIAGAPGAGQSTAEFAKTLRNNQYLREMLRGPVGPPGVAGPQGMVGPTGAMGPAGVSETPVTHKTTRTRRGHSSE